MAPQASSKVPEGSTPQPQNVASYFVSGRCAWHGLTGRRLRTLAKRLHPSCTAECRGTKEEAVRKRFRSLSASSTWEE